VAVSGRECRLLTEFTANGVARSSGSSSHLRAHVRARRGECARGSVAKPQRASASAQVGAGTLFRLRPRITHPCMHATGMLIRPEQAEAWAAYGPRMTKPYASAHSRRSAAPYLAFAGTGAAFRIS
jgi:hypothetical protein